MNIKLKVTLLSAIILLGFSSLVAQNLNPYILGIESTKSVSDLKVTVKSSLEKSGLQVVGQYQPAGDKNRWIIVFSSMELQGAVKQIGGLTGFASTLRLGITSENGKTLVTYTNPIYWGNAYFRDDFDKVASNYTTISGKLKTAMKSSGTFIGTSYGSEKGLSVEDLRKYHYMMGMPYFDDPVELEDFDSYKAAISKIESSLKKGLPNVKQVYKVSIPDKELTLYGFALSGEDGEGKFLPTIDITNPKHTAFLPYEVLVKGNEVLMLHGRFRIALSFPDLTMGTFTKIMSTPGNIEDLLEQLVEDEDD